MTVKNSSCVECGRDVADHAVCRMCGRNDLCIRHINICRTCSRGICDGCKCDHHDSGHGVISVDGKILARSDTDGTA